MQKNILKISPNPRSQEVIQDHRLVFSIRRMPNTSGRKAGERNARITHPRAPGTPAEAQLFIPAEAFASGKSLAIHTPKHVPTGDEITPILKRSPRRPATTSIHSTVPLGDPLFRTFPRASFLKARFVLLKQPLLRLRLVQDRGLALYPGKWRYSLPFQCARVSVALTHVCIAPERIDGRGLSSVRRRR